MRHNLASIRRRHGNSCAWLWLQLLVVLMAVTWLLFYAAFFIPTANDHLHLSRQPSISRFYSDRLASAVVVSKRRNMTRVKILVQQRLDARRKVSSGQKGVRRDPREIIAICSIFDISRRRDFQRLVNSIDATVIEQELVSFRFMLVIGYHNPRRLLKLQLKLMVPEWLLVKYAPFRHNHRDLAVNRLFSTAFHAGADYALFTPAHAEFVGVNWASLAVNRLQAHVPSNFGVVVISDVDYEFEGILVHATHESILHKFYSWSTAEKSPIWYRRIYAANQTSILPGLCIVSERPPVYPRLSISPSMSYENARNWVQRLAVFRLVAQNGYSAKDSPVLPAFQALQEEHVRQLSLKLTPRTLRKPLRVNVNVLIAMSVSNKRATLSNVGRWLRYFRAVLERQRKESGKNDRVNFIFNHYEPISQQWRHLKEMYPALIRPEMFELHCKLELWQKLTDKLTAPYDYVWLVDEDMDLSFFSWELARLILYRLDPLVAAPGVVPVSRSGRRSIWETTHMQASYWSGTNSLVLARNSWFAEAMVPFISTKFWPLVLNRLTHWDIRGLYCIDCFWSHAVNKWAGKLCGRRAPLIIMDAAPLVHLDRRTMGELLDQSSTPSPCRRTAIKANRYLSAFPPDIMNPKNTSRDVDKSAAKVLKNKIAPVIECIGTSKFHKTSRWSLDNI